LLLWSPITWARDQLVIGLSSFPSQFHPDVNPEAVKAYIEGLALRPLTLFDASWRKVCASCAELPSLENGLVRLETAASGKPGMAVTVKLRPDQFWGDGVQVTAEDIAFTAKVGWDPNSGFANTHTWGKVDRVEVIDPLTATLHLAEISADFDRLPGLLPAHLEGKVYDAAGSPGEYIVHSLYVTAPTTPGLWNGPYRLTRIDTGSTVVLEPNPFWKGTKPGFARIVFKTVANTAALLANLQAGDVDMTPGEGMGLTIDQVIALEKQGGDRFDFIWKPALTYDHIDLQLDNPIFADVRVRRALLHAIDRQAITQRLFAGKLPIADAWVSPLELIHEKDVPRYKFDPAKARALLAEAGWKPGTDGVCRNAEGKKLSFEFIVGAGVKLRELMQEVIQNQWKAVCVETVLKRDPPRLLFGEELKRRTFTGVAMYTWLFEVESSPRQILGSNHIPRAENNWSGTNYMGWRNAIVDAGIRTVETELDPAKRQIAWSAMQREYASELPVLPLFFRVEGHMIPKWLKGYVPTGHNDYAVYSGENWRSE